MPSHKTSLFHGPIVRRAAIDAFLEKSGAALWIQHDFRGMAKIRKAPLYYE